MTGAIASGGLRVAVIVEVPDLGEDMAGGIVAEWYSADGAAVEPGMPVCRIESCYVAVELEAEGAGMLRHRKPAGSIERPGAVLGLILAPGEAMPAEPEPKQQASATSEPPAQIAAFTAALAAVEDEAPAPESGVDDLIEPEPEFEEALVEAVVVPFPRRFAAQAAPQDWDDAPGDAGEFETTFFSGEPPERTEALPDPGSHIPGLPLWEPEDVKAGEAAFLAQATERFARNSSEAAASMQMLSMAIAVDVREAERMREVCARESKRFGTAPLIEDIVLRALALALEDTPFAGGTGGLMVAGREADSFCAIASAAAKTFREAASAREKGGDAAFESADWALTSLAAFGVSTATPRLDGGRNAGFAMGAVDSGGVLTLTMSYDSGSWHEGSAARLLARAREILEAPYAMLV